MKSYWRFVVAVGLLAGTALLLQVRNSAEIIPTSQPLNSFPMHIKDWNGIEVPISQDELDVLGPGDFLRRDYQNNRARVNLFMAYFKSQRSGDTIHSPKNCLPGAGWAPIQSDRITVSLPGQAPFPANRYLIAQGENRQLVLYWYLAHNRVIASEYSAKFYLVADSIRMRRTDGSLIRFVTPLMPGEKVDAAQERLLSLAADVVPLLSDYVPR